MDVYFDNVGIDDSVGQLKFRMAVWRVYGSTEGLNGGAEGSTCQLKV